MPFGCWSRNQGEESFLPGKLDALEKLLGRDLFGLGTGVCGERDAS
jgi:hypothetical protein